LSRHGSRDSNDGRNSAPSWQDYIEALKLEGRRYRPASLTKALEERDAAGGNPRHCTKKTKEDGGGL